MHHHLLRPLAVTCLALATCTPLVQGVAEDGVASPSSPSEWPAPPVSPLHLGSPGAAWRHLPPSERLVSFLADPRFAMRPETVPQESPRPLRTLHQGVPKRLYFAPRLGKRSVNLAQEAEERDRRGDVTYPEEPHETGLSPYRWWWPLVSVRRSSFSPRPGKRAEAEEDLDLPYDFPPDDFYDTRFQDELEDQEDEETQQEKRDDGFSFSPRLGKRGKSGFSFGPRPGKKDTFSFGPRLGKRDFAFSPRPGKKSLFAFAPRPGKKSTFAFSPRPGKKTNFAFGPRPGKKTGFAFGPRAGKRSDIVGDATGQEGDSWWVGESNGAIVTTLPPY